MKALQLSSFGSPTDVVELAEIEPDDPGPRQLTVAIEAAPINPSDLMLIRGIYGVHPELPAALGAEGVGRVIAVGDGVDASRAGERVLVVPTLEQATWRQTTVLDERNGVPVDADGDPLQLAMLGINPITAYCLLHGYAKLAPGAWGAQTGASSATAGYVVALAKYAGLRTLNVVRRADSVMSIPVLDLIFRGLNVHGYWLNRWLDSTPRETIARTYRELAALVENGTLAAPVEATYALADYREAIGHAARNDRHGKVLFTFH